MSKPTSTADFGTVVSANPAKNTPGRTVNTSRGHARFKDIKAFSTGTMPTVTLGAIYEDLDPRCAGRRIQVLDVDRNNIVTVRTVIASRVPPRTPAGSRKHKVGTLSRIQLRRFRENSRGFRFIHDTSPRNAQALRLAAKISVNCGLTVTEVENRVADALIGLLGYYRATGYVDELIRIRSLRSLYRRSNISRIILDATTYAEENLTPQWKKTPIFSRDVATSLLAYTHDSD